MADSPHDPSPGLSAFLQPLQVDRDRIYALSRGFATTFTHLAAESANQFLSTPISESILSPPKSTKKRQQGRYLAIDIGGTNLRVGFVELLGGSYADSDSPSLNRLLERSWPIQEHLKTQNMDSFFAWIGSCIATVVRQGCANFGLSLEEPLPMGVTFSFPMGQESLSKARLMLMGKGFALAPNLDLGSCLIRGYDHARAACATQGSLPPITVAAITNDAVATLVSFVYELPANANRKAAMGLICGTGSNATLLLKRSLLHPSKRPSQVSVLKEAGGIDGVDGVDERDQMKVAVNTEWSINGSESAMRAVGFVSRWDDQLSQTVEMPGFQPLEYMTSGRYLGELGRIMLVDYITSVLGLAEAALPARFMRRFEPQNTSFLSHYRPGRQQPLLALLEAEFPIDEAGDQNGVSSAQPFQWTQDIAIALYHIAKVIETRAAAIIAAATVGLLDCAGELPPVVPPPTNGSTATTPLELVVGYTGGCITNFQDYLTDCQAFLDDLMVQRYGSSTPPVRILLSPCHDGGIKGAGILVPAALASQEVSHRS